MSWFCRNMPLHVRQHMATKITKSDDPDPPAIDTAREGSFYQEYGEFRRRLRVAKAEREGGHVDMNILAISGARVRKADVVEADQRVKLFAFRTLYPAMAANAGSQAELNALSSILWDALDPEEQRRFVADAPEEVSPDSGGDVAQTVQAIRANFTQAMDALRELQGSGRIEFKAETGELDTSRMSVDAWTSRRQELRRKAETTTVRKHDMAGLRVAQKGDVTIPARRLHDTDVQFISLVDRAATRMPIRVVKKDPGAGQMIDLSRVFATRATAKA